MQCTRCAHTLPEGVNFCLFCGAPLNNPSDAARSGALPITGGAKTDIPFAQAPVNHTGQEEPGAAGAGFAFQEFSTPFRLASTLTPIPPGVLPGYAGVPPYPFQPGGQGVYAPPVAPIAAIPPAPKRWGRSVGCIVLYAFLAIALLFAGLSVTLYEIGSHVLGNVQANSATTKTAAMQLYRQITSQPPAIQDPLTGSSSNLWQNFEASTYGCTLAQDGLHAHISDTNHFFYCLNTANFFANVAFQVQMQMLTGDAGGLVFRASTAADDSSSSLYLFQVTSGGSYALYLDKDTNTSQVSRLASGTTRAMDAQSEQANTLTVIAQGHVFDLYINQQFVAQVQDATLATGAIGVLADDHARPTDVLYTNAKLWDLDK